MAALTPLPSSPIRLSSVRAHAIQLAEAPVVAEYLPENPRRRLPVWPGDIVMPSSNKSEPIFSADFPTPPDLEPMSGRPITSLPWVSPSVPSEIPTRKTSIDETDASEPFTDEDLREALKPLLGEIYPNQSMGSALEPMLRATMRRALAEHTPTNRPFRTPGVIDRFMWRMQALFTSRTYEDILFEKTHRFQVEEVFLLDAATLAMISFASCDPARHASIRRVEGTAQRLALQLKDDAGVMKNTFTLPDYRKVMVCSGKYIILTALVRGEPSEMLQSDLAYALQRIEERFRERFRRDGSPLMFVLQPFLEDCLLIQSPASAA